MISRALNKDNDIFLGSGGSWQTVKDSAEVVQHLRTRLQFLVGEWFLDISAGLPYFQSIMIKPADLGNIESIIKTEVLSTDGISKLNEFRLDYSGGSERKLKVSMSVSTIYEELIKEEVYINV